MADYPNNTTVLHGEGKPRLWVITDAIWTGTNSAGAATTITLNGTPALDDLDTEYGLANFVVYSYSSSVLTWAKIVSWNDGTDVLTVDAWNNGTPDNSQTTYIQHKRLDLPYCQSLIETFTPDFVVKKMLDGSIRRIKRGYYYSAALNFSRYINKNTFMLFRDLYRIDYSRFAFYPRLDNQGLVYQVDLAPGTDLTFHQLRAHQGHGAVVINLVGIERLTEVKLYDPTVEAGYGYGYGQSYGTQL